MEAFYFVLRNVSRKMAARSTRTPLLIAALGINFLGAATAVAQEQSRPYLRQNPQQIPPPNNSDIADAGEARCWPMRNRRRRKQQPAEYGEIIKLCMEARQQPLSKKSAIYVDQLLGWTYNRRGEMYYARALAARPRRGRRPTRRNTINKLLADFEKRRALMM